MIERILVAYDESKEAARALRTGIDLCRALGADLKVVTVVKPLPAYFSFAPSARFADDWLQEQQTRCSGLQRHARQQLTASGVYPDAELICGDEVSVIVDCAKKYRADLLIVAIREHSVRSAHMREDVTEQAPCSVMEVR